MATVTINVEDARFMRNAASTVFGQQAGLEQPESRTRREKALAGLIRSLHPAIKRKVRGVLEAIVETPTCGKPLREELAGLRSYGMGKYRMVYRIAEDLSVEIVAIGPRRHIYEETYRKVKGQNP